MGVNHGKDGSMLSSENVTRLLRHYGRNDLARLLQRARFELQVSSTYGNKLFSQLTTVEIYTPISDCEKLRSLPEKDEELILRALIDIVPPKPHDIEINDIEFFVDPNSLTAEAPADEELLAAIEAQRNLMIAVATGGPRIQSVDDEYRERRALIQDALRKKGVRDPNPYSDLWAWYGKWSSGDLPSYQSRRQYISELYESLIELIRSGPKGQRAEVFDEPTGWVKVDRSLGEIRLRLERASSEEQFQAVGLLCRETLISLAQIVFDPDIHKPLDDVSSISKTDAKRMLEAYLAHEMRGRSNEVARRHAKAALDLANVMQHRRTATFRQAAFCAEATTSVVNLIAIISGRRDPES